MKKYTILFLLAVSMASCKKAEVQPYDNECNDSMDSFFVNGVTTSTTNEPLSTATYAVRDCGKTVYIAKEGETVSSYTFKPTVVTDNSISGKLYYWSSNQMKPGELIQNITLYKK